MEKFVETDNHETNFTRDGGETLLNSDMPSRLAPSPPNRVNSMQHENRSKMNVSKEVAGGNLTQKFYENDPDWYRGSPNLNYQKHKHLSGLVNTDRPVDHRVPRCYLDHTSHKLNTKRLRHDHHTKKGWTE